MVQSGFWKLRVQSEPVAVAVAPDQGPKTGLNRTFKHYFWPILTHTINPSMSQILSTTLSYMPPSSTGSVSHLSTHLLLGILTPLSLGMKARHALHFPHCHANVDGWIDFRYHRWAAVMAFEL